MKVAKTNLSLTSNAVSRIEHQSEMSGKIEALMMMTVIEL